MDHLQVRVFPKLRCMTNSLKRRLTTLIDPLLKVAPALPDLVGDVRKADNVVGLRHRQSTEVQAQSQRRLQADERFPVGLSLALDGSQNVRSERM